MQAGCAGGPLAVLSWEGLVQQYLGKAADAEGAAVLAAPALDYWALPPDARLRALHRLCHTALDTPQLRCAEHILAARLRNSSLIDRLFVIMPSRPRLLNPNPPWRVYEPRQPRNILLLASQHPI